MALTIDPNWSVRSPLKTTRRRLGSVRGLGAVEVIVIIALLTFLALCVLIVLPKGRETSRMAGCQKNLMQIGVGLQLYEQANRHYPTMPRLGEARTGDSTVQAMLKALALPDFLDLRDPTQAPKPTESPYRGARVAGLACPSDPQAISGTFQTALSYRGNAGDGTDGSNGPFSPGVHVTSSMVEDGDGLSYTAGFAERLVGTGRDRERGPMNYAVVPGAVTGPCGSLDDGRRWRGDAGSSWDEPGWRSAIYSHAVSPNALTSCVADDGLTASMTASSPHPGRINVMMLDGSLRGINPTIDLSVWKALGSIRSESKPVEPIP